MKKNKEIELLKLNFDFIDTLNTEFMNLEFLDTFEIAEIEVLKTEPLPFKVLKLEPTEEQKKKKLYDKTRLNEVKKRTKKL